MATIAAGEQPPPDACGFVLEVDDTSCVVSVWSSIEPSDVEHFEWLLGSAAPSAERPVVVDLSATPALAASAVDALVAQHDRSANPLIVVAHPHSPSKRTLDHAHADERLTIVPSVDAALELAAAP